MIFLGYNQISLAWVALGKFYYFLLSSNLSLHITVLLTYADHSDINSRSFLIFYQDIFLMRLVMVDNYTQKTIVRHSHRLY